MPPDVAPIPLPVTTGYDARDYLEAHGLPSTIPPLHSSDFEKCLANPFQFYLERRLGIVSAFSISEARTQGTWFHQYFQYAEEDPEPHCVRALANREQELRDICKAFGITGDNMMLRLVDEREAFANAKCWYNATFQVPFKLDGSNTTYSSFHEFISLPHWRFLAAELKLEFILDRKGYDKTPLIVQFDRLYYHTGQNTLWIGDAKTDANGPAVRIHTCPIEFQTRHYLFVAKQLLPWLIDKFGLPHDCKLGGMMHIIIQKPTIRFGMRDRPLIGYRSEGIRSKRNGFTQKQNNYWITTISSTNNLDVMGGLYTTPARHDKLEDALKWHHEQTNKKPEAERGGEPSHDLYIQRCLDWYLGRGEHADEAPKRQLNPPINVSFTEADLLLDEVGTDTYFRDLDLIHRYATCPAIPFNFPQSAAWLRQHKTLSPYTPFYVCPVKDWPEIMQRGRFTIQHRDPLPTSEEITDDSD